MDDTTASYFFYQENMNILHNLRQFFSLKKYSKELRLSPLFIETSVSILAGLFMFIWGVIFFSNPLYQFSLFTKLRNIGITLPQVETYLSDIYCIGIDPEARMALTDEYAGGIDSEESKPLTDEHAGGIDSEEREPLTDEYAGGIDSEEREPLTDEHAGGIDSEEREPLIDEHAGGDFSQFDLIADGLKVISTYAETQKEKRIVVGIDYVFAVPGSVKPFKSIRKALAEMPSNVFVVFGGSLSQRPDTLTTFRARLIEEQLIDPLYDIDAAIVDRLFIGNIHYDRGSIRSGFESDEDIKAAIGYYPLISMGIKSFASLPLAMFIAGEITTEDEDGYYDFYTDFGEGLTMFSEDMNMSAKLNEQSKMSLPQLERQLFYNFFTGRDIAQFKKHFMWLSAVSPRFENSTGGLKKYFEMPYINRKVTTGKAEYFFISQSEMPGFLLGEGNTNDVILTPASGKNPFTYENDTVMGVMSHITALSNLKHCSYIKKVPSWIHISLSCIVVLLIFIFSWTRDLGKSMLFSTLIIFFYIAITFILFCFGYFIPVTSAFALSFMVFGLVAILRFILTTNKYELYEMVASRVFSATQMEKLRGEADWKQPQIIEDAIIMVLFPRKLPDFGKTEAEAQRYTQIYDKFLSLVFQSIELNEGNHLTLSMDGILGFWNIPVREDESEYKAFTCAQQCLHLVKEWQMYIDRLYAVNKQPYTASFDICLHYCECYAGCVGTGDTLNYSISGFGINFAIEATIFQTGDKLNTLFLTKEFYERLKSTTGLSKGDFEKTSYTDTNLYSWKFTK